MADLPPEAMNDCFHPPSIPTEVECIHCGETYDSWRIEWRESVDAEGNLQGFWCCPIPGCDGAGFGFDIHPTDPEYIDPDGRDMGEWVEFDEDEAWSEEFDEASAPDGEPPEPIDDEDIPY